MGLLPTGILTDVSEAQLNVGLLQWKIGFKSPNIYLKSEWLLVLFVWSKMAQGSLGLPVLDSEMQNKQKHHGPPGPPNFHDFHIWTDSLEQATLDVIL